MKPSSSLRSGRKLDQHDYRKKYDGYASRYAALESRMDSLEKERERKGTQHGDLKPEAAGALGLRQMSPDAFSVHGNKVLLCMEICKDLRYNFENSYVLKKQVS